MNQQQTQPATAGQTTTDNGLIDQTIQATPRETIVGRAAAFLGTEPSKVFNLLRGAWPTGKGEPPLSNEELTSGLALVARYELDPLAREVYVTRHKGKLMTVIGVDGWVRVLDRTPHYDGFDVEFAWKDEAETEVKWIETTIYSKTREHPTKYRAFAAEYSRLSGFVAKSIPIHMLRIFSLRHAVRLFTPISGATSEDEARWMINNQPAGTPDKPSVDDLLNQRDIPTEAEKAAEKAAELPNERPDVPFGAGGGRTKEKPLYDPAAMDAAAEEYCQAFEGAKDLLAVEKLFARMMEDDFIQQSPDAAARCHKAAHIARGRFDG